jgi:hypothetical protein
LTGWQKLNDKREKQLAKEAKEVKEAQEVKKAKEVKEAEKAEGIRGRKVKLTEALKGRQCSKEVQPLTDEKTRSERGKRCLGN